MSSDTPGDVNHRSEECEVRLVYPLKGVRLRGKNVQHAVCCPPRYEWHLFVVGLSAGSAGTKEVDPIAVDPDTITVDHTTTIRPDAVTITEIVVKKKFKWRTRTVTDTVTLTADGGGGEGGEPKGNCNPNYSGCLDANASDYDCAGGSGNGPLYTGTVTVIGYDEYGLDADGDGTGCD